MLVISSAQMQAFSRQIVAKFENEQLCHFLDTYLVDCRLAGESAVRELIHQGNVQAEAAGFVTRRQASLWIGLHFMLGVDFHCDPQLPWLISGLQDSSISNATMRLDVVFDKAIDYLEATAGPNCIHLSKAIERLRRWDWSTLPDASVAQWESQMCMLLEHTYPEKFAFQGPDASTELIRSAETQAQTRGFDLETGPAVFATLAFFLGSGFDHDLLFPWTGEVLAPMVGEEATDRSRTLFDAGLRYLNNSLADA